VVLQILASMNVTPGGLRFVLIALLMLCCLAIAISMPIAARRGKLHVPGYLGLAGLTFVVSIILGKLSGSRHIAGSAAGIIFSVVFFLLIAMTFGSVVALFVYRRPSNS
jgi:ABC-type multidrug transport system permease subunit